LEWRIGVAYATGLSDVADLHEDNLNASGLEADVDLKVPLGLAGGVTYDWPSGMRFDLTLGPTFFIGGDVSHSELPLGATIGYNFMREADISPFVRAGIVQHFASGDYETGSSPGLVVAAGVDFQRVTIEVAFDDSEVDFEFAECDANGANCTPAVRSLNTYDVIASVYWRFR
jgi:preprotein translocase subunit Sec61beta